VIASRPVQYFISVLYPVNPRNPHSLDVHMLRDVWNKIVGDGRIIEAMFEVEAIHRTA
jgi:hypothetical protein